MPGLGGSGAGAKPRLGDAPASACARASRCRGTCKRRHRCPKRRWANPYPCIPTFNSDALLSSFGGSPMNGPSTLSAAEIEQIAHRVVALLSDAGYRTDPPRYVDASELAAELGVERDWVYSHAEELGAMRLGGPRGRLRFDRAVVREQMRRTDPAASGNASPGRNAAPGWTPPHRPTRRLGSSQTQRRASGRTPARSPKQHRPGGNPDDEA